MNNHISNSSYSSSELPAYQKLRNANHRFQSTALYSFADIGRIIGMTDEAVRQRALADQWPCAEIYIRPGRVRRSHFVFGEFLAGLQRNGGMKP